MTVQYDRLCNRDAHILELYTLRVCLYTVYNLVREKKMRVFTVLGYKFLVLGRWNCFRWKYIFLYIYLCWWITVTCDWKIVEIEIIKKTLFKNWTGHNDQWTKIKKQKDLRGLVCYFFFQFSWDKENYISYPNLTFAERVTNKLFA